MTRQEAVAEILVCAAGPDFEAALDKFFELCEADAEFINDCPGVSNENLIGALTLALPSLIGPHEPLELRACQDPDSSLVHGAIQSSEYIGTVLWFDRELVGVIAISRQDDVAPDTKVARLRLARLPGPCPVHGPAPSRN